MSLDWDGRRANTTIAMDGSSYVGTYDKLVLTVDGGNAPIVAGAKGYLEVPFNCEIIHATLLADAVCSCEMDIRRCAIEDFPPAAEDSIVAAAPPTLSSAQSMRDTTLTGWTTTLLGGDILEFYLTSVSVAERLHLFLKVRRG